MEIEGIIIDGTVYVPIDSTKCEDCVFKEVNMQSQCNFSNISTSKILQIKEKLANLAILARKNMLNSGSCEMQASHATSRKCYLECLQLINETLKS